MIRPKEQQKQFLVASHEHDRPHMIGIKKHIRRIQIKLLTVTNKLLLIKSKGDTQSVACASTVRCREVRTRKQCHMNQF